MISLDIESSGLDTGKCGIWQIGAVEIENPENTFLQEARLDDEDEVMEDALKVIGKSEEELRNPDKQSQKQLLINFFEWTKTCKNKIIVGQNVGWDLSFIQNKCLKYGIIDQFRESVGHRSFDMHTLAQMKYKEKHGEYKLREGGRSDMKLPNTLEFCGIKDYRREVVEGEIVKEGAPHNALEDAKLTAECFRRLTK